MDSNKNSLFLSLLFVNLNDWFSLGYHCSPFTMTLIKKDFLFNISIWFPFCMFLFKKKKQQLRFTNSYRDNTLNN